ncbi:MULTISPECIES: helix-turn-helix domain-containing protein [Streptacidiphilus]|uniref:Helix-turn-helix domain-containing protein n=1 Tax=Streptacidiphilus cavernicola TaxID=3342716 RepID=A0ABV6V007_9ACTN|nr:helix-turn-helix domain-containing protein [Streptacidiphilus jeojiense]
MLDSIGLDAVAERAYELLLRQESASAASMAEELGVPQQRARRALDTLAAGGLATRLPGRALRYTPIDPRAGLSALVRSRQAELERVASSVDAYAAEYHERTLRTDPHRLVEVIEGPAEITHRVQELIAGAEKEIMAFDAPPYVTPHGSASEIEHPVLARGVAVRAIYATEVLAVPVLADRLRAMVALGEQARVVSRVPMKMVLVDRSDAMLPLTASEEGVRTTAVFVRRSTLCDALVELFEANWSVATPVFTETSPTDDVSAEDRDLLHLLNAGLKDEAIARQLGLSERTLRRRIAELTRRLGATSRFQAGTQAMRREWL